VEKPKATILHTWLRILTPLTPSLMSGELLIRARASGSLRDDEPDG
jgi:hypothetical protein